MADGQLMRSVIEDGPYGGTGGYPWSDGGEIHLNGLPTTVDVRSGKFIDAIRIR